MSGIISCNNDYLYIKECLNTLWILRFNDFKINLQIFHKVKYVVSVWYIGY